MELVLSFVKNYFTLVFILLVFSYLVPKEEYKKYFQFFIGVLIAVALLRPVLSWMDPENTSAVYENLNEISQRLERIQYHGEEENLFELFFVEDDTQ